MTTNNGIQAVGTLVIIKPDKGGLAQKAEKMGIVLPDDVKDRDQISAT